VVSIVFFSVILGMVEVGRGLMVQYLLMNAAREGCRAGIIPGRTTDNITTTANNKLAGEGIQSATVTVLVNGAAGEAGNASSGDTIQVSVQVPVSQVTWVPFTQYLPASLTGQYALRRE
jgi:Flp pilus assembly protein TadG